VIALYNPTVGANIMSNFVALTFLGNKTLAPTSKIFKSSFGSIVEGYGILQNVSVRHKDVEAVGVLPAAHRRVYPRW
jgi:hypothetical protein